MYADHFCFLQYVLNLFEDKLESSFFRIPAITVLSES